MSNIGVLNKGPLFPNMGVCFNGVCMRFVVHTCMCCIVDGCCGCLDCSVGLQVLVVYVALLCVMSRCIGYVLFWSI